MKASSQSKKGHPAQMAGVLVDGLGNGLVGSISPRLIMRG
jgi:hypothetical protein